MCAGSSITQFLVPLPALARRLTLRWFNAFLDFRGRYIWVPLGYNIMVYFLSFFYASNPRVLSEVVAGKGGATALLPLSMDTLLGPAAEIDQ